MNNKRLVTAVAAGAVVVMGLSACGGNGTDGKNGGGGTKTPAFNAALTETFNPSEKKGGIVKIANAGTWDSLDPGETYYGYSWNFLRLYGRSLLMFKPAPGGASNELVPDLAESLGTPSEGGKTWTYKLREGIKYEDGTTVTSKDVKHAVLRSTDKETFPNGPAYFEGYLNLPEGYKGPYKSKGVDTNSAIETPDDRTIVFHLKQAFGGFDYFAHLPQTVPVPEAKDTGAKYREHVISTGPYKFDKNEIDKQFNLVRNPEWKPETDPNRKALPDGYEVTMNVNADDIDNRLISGDIHIDITGTGVQPASLSRVLSDPAIKANADNPTIARLWYTSINPTVAPLDNKECRKAVLYAVDRTGYQTAYGGTFSGGEIATTLMPSQIPGAEKFDLYPAGPDNKGDVAKAKEALTACGQPNGFETNIAYRSERPKEKAAAESMQQALARVGIKLTLRPFPQGDYFSQFAGNPPYVVANKLGMALNGWGADWNDGFGFLSQIVDSRVIRETGGSSNTSVRIPEVDKMLDEAIGETDTAKREKMWGAIDKRVMEEAVILPGVHSKSLILRGKGLTNVFVSDAYGMYDYLAMGLE
ncbi:peptide/nickel transport system substrate-binding protein [Actinokineospora alba]|uniref:Peptide/nickel transport system substrate-binding protein n=1 Tax=Actinokineospora alba TaxID=504798 RepID=A0A1H0T3B8_9PSEU|nr:ABC transporter substrate-binding protein [Actinokineospora alba]TDP66382.1 peptide/nickel transport system substrate-binding protein [Actinokineospora alba]SDJ23614.1 peptide/nickel transport system substrate-binding protein [Actinokineospora alba]SDP48612.1 peptide/nickel transport system substrate-binding protein [Actinokineospora alba]